jgi:hypothetical protein
MDSLLDYKYNKFINITSLNIYFLIIKMSTKSIKDFSNSIDVLEKCTKEVKRVIEMLPNNEENVLKMKLEREIFDKNIKNMKISELDKYITEYGNVMVSKLYFDNLNSELKEFRTMFKSKVTTEVKNIQEKMQLHIESQLNIQKAQSDKELGILNSELKFTKQKLEYVCRFNKFLNIEEE